MTPPTGGQEDTQGLPLFIYPDVSLHLQPRPASLVKAVNMLIFPWLGPGWHTELLE